MHVNLYVTGRSEGLATGDDYVTISYDSNGGELWVARYNGPGNDTDQARAITIDVSGNVIVTGGSIGAGTGYDYATVAYDSFGAELWVARYDGPKSGWDKATALTVGEEGHVYVTGWCDTFERSNDYATIRYDPAGNELWVNYYDGPESSWDKAEAITMDTEGFIYVTGLSHGIWSEENFATVRYGPEGKEIWSARYNGLQNGPDGAVAILVDADRFVYVTGYSQGRDTGIDYATIKYEQRDCFVGALGPSA